MEKTFEEALSKFMTDLQAMMNKHCAGSHVDPPTMVIGGGTKYIKIVREGTGRSAYCFIEKATGNILKPGGWKAPEPKKHPRGNIYQENNLDGCGPYGVVYLRR